MTGSSIRPRAQSAGVSARMASQRERDTRIEINLRKELHRRGLRYRLHRRLLKGLRREVDITFVSARVAVFVDGCFWHCCPDHGSTPTNNREWWEQKLAANRKRDSDTDERLAAEGWAVVRVWEHEEVQGAADRVQSLVTSRELHGMTSHRERSKRPASN